LPEPGNVAGRSSRELARGVAGVTAASMVGNVAAYVLLLAAARGLGAREYSSFVAMMNVLLVGSVLSFALQAVAARRVAVGHTHDLIQVGAGLAICVGVLFAVLTPAEIAFLHLPSPTLPLLVAAAIPGMALQGLCQGVWQGAERFSGLAKTTLAGLLGRSGGGLAGLWIGHSAASAIGVLMVTATVTALICLSRLPRVRSDENDAVNSASIVAESSSLLIECGHAAHAYGVFLLLSVSDVLLASHVLPTSSAAVYAAGSVMTKAALWLPQSVANVLFASMTDTGRHRGLLLRGAAAIIGLGCAVTVSCWALGPLVSSVVAGNRYPQLHSEIWLFAALGSCLALLQFTLVTGLAIRSGRVSTLAWATIGAEILAILIFGDRDDVRSIVEIVTLINLVSAGASLLLRAGLPFHPNLTVQSASSPGQSPGENTAL
jgi:O-antigen/teichoic acid export membrane protein